MTVFVVQALTDKYMTFTENQTEGGDFSSL